MNTKKAHRAKATLWVGILPEELKRFGDKPNFQLVHYAFHEGEERVELEDGLYLLFIEIPDPNELIIHTGLGLPITDSISMRGRLRTFSEISLKYIVVHTKVKESLLFLGVEDPEDIIQTFIVADAFEVARVTPKPPRHLLA